MTASVLANDRERGAARAATALRALRSESAVARVAIAAAALHVADDNFLQPQPGPSAGDHLASGLIPLAILAAVALLYPRLRAGARAGLAMTLGAIAITFGVPGVYYLLDGSASRRPLHRPARDRRRRRARSLSAPVTLWRARRTDGKPRRRYLRRRSSPWRAVLAGVVCSSSSRSASRTSTRTRDATAVTPDLGVPYERVEVTDERLAEARRVLRPVERTAPR